MNEKIGRVDQSERNETRLTFTGELDSLRRQLEQYPQLAQRYRDWQAGNIPDAPPFEAVYKAVTDWNKKLLMILAAGDQTVDEDMGVLLEDFIPKGEPLTPDAKHAKQLAAAYMVEKGLIAPDSSTQAEAQNELWELITSDEDMLQLADVLPSYVWGAIATTKYYAHITDQEKQEKIRSHMTRTAALRPHLHTIEWKRPTGELTIHDLTTIIPENVFASENKVIYNIVRDYFLGEAFRLFQNVPDEVGFERLQAVIDEESTDVRKEFLQNIMDEFKSIQQIPIPEVFKDSLPGWFTETSQFPLFRQKYFVYRFLQNNNRMLLNGETGATKTACSLLAAETCKADKVTIFGPAVARNTWPKEIQNIFKDGQQPEVTVIRGQDDLGDYESAKGIEIRNKLVRSKYMYISSELLSRCSSNPGLRTKVFEVITERQQDQRAAIIIDEADEFRNIGANCTQVLVEIMSTMQEMHKKNADVVSENMPVMALTATPISTSIEDLDVPMGLLYPERYGIPNQPNTNKPIFSMQVLRDPKVAYSLLFGEKLMMQWTIKDLFGDKIPDPDVKRLQLPLNASQKVIYDWVCGISTDSLSKINLLRTVLLNPEIIKESCRKNGWIPKHIRSKDELKTYFRELHKGWTDWYLGKGRDRDIPEEPFSAEWIAKMGEVDFLLECFFSEEFHGGIDGLASEMRDIMLDWVEQETTSSKFTRLQKQIHGNIRQGRKTFVVSPYRRGITRDLNTCVSEEDLKVNTLSLYEHMIAEWLPELPKGSVVSIDGSRSFKYRDKAAEQWRFEGSKANVVLATLDSVRESMNFAVKDTEDNQNITGVNVIYLGWPYGWDEFKQMNGRFIRPGLTKPVSIDIYENEGTIDAGFYDLVRRKQLLIDMALAGVGLTPEEQEFFNRNSANRCILTYEAATEENYYRKIVQRVKAIGEEGLSELLHEDNQGVKNSEIFAKHLFFDGKDRFRLSGNNATMIAGIILNEHPQARRIGVVGAGSCLLNRELSELGYERGIDNFDLNNVIMQMARDRFHARGRLFTSKASELTNSSEGARIPKETYDILDYSFMLHWSKLFERDKSIPANPYTIDRVKILLEMNRVLKTDGTVMIALPESCLDDEQFLQFTKCLVKNFGFALQDGSGKSYATDVYPPKRIGWLLQLKKVGSVNFTGFQPEELKLLSDEATIISKGNGKNGNGKRSKTIDNPMFHSNNFKIVNPLSGDEIQISAPEIAEEMPAIALSGDIFVAPEAAEPVIVNPTDMITQAGGFNADSPERVEQTDLAGQEVSFKQLLLTDQLRVYNSLRRYMEAILANAGIDAGYEVSEAFLSYFLEGTSFIEIQKVNDNQVKALRATLSLTLSKIFQRREKQHKGLPATVEDWQESERAQVHQAIEIALKSRV